MYYQMFHIYIYGGYNFTTTSYINDEYIYKLNDLKFYQYNDTNYSSMYKLNTTNESSAIEYTQNSNFFTALYKNNSKIVLYMIPEIIITASMPPASVNGEICYKDDNNVPTNIIFNTKSNIYNNKLTNNIEYIRYTEGYGFKI